MTNADLAARLAALMDDARPHIGNVRSMRAGNQYVGCTREAAGAWKYAALVGASRIDGLSRPWNPFSVMPAIEQEEVVRFTDEVADLIDCMLNNFPAILAALKAPTHVEGFAAGIEAAARTARTAWMRADRGVPENAVINQIEAAIRALAPPAPAKPDPTDEQRREIREAMEWLLRDPAYGGNLVRMADALRAAGLLEE